MIYTETEKKELMKSAGYLRSIFGSARIMSAVVGQGGLRLAGHRPGAALCGYRPSD